MTIKNMRFVCKRFTKRGNYRIAVSLRPVMIDDSWNPKSYMLKMWLDRATEVNGCSIGGMIAKTLWRKQFSNYLTLRSHSEHPRWNNLISLHRKRNGLGKYRRMKIRLFYRIMHGGQWDSPFHGLPIIPRHRVKKS